LNKLESASSWEELGLDLLRYPKNSSGLPNSKIGYSFKDTISKRNTAIGAKWRAPCKHGGLMMNQMFWQHTTNEELTGYFCLPF